jgi:restriction system protein
MTIPSYEALMLPILKLVGQKQYSMRELIERMETDLGLSEHERSALIPSGKITVIASRTHWAKTYLKQAGLVTQPSRGYVQITPLGRSVLAEAPDHIDGTFLRRFDVFREFLMRAKTRTEPTAPMLSSGGDERFTTVDPGAAPTGQLASASTPDEQIEAALITLNETLREALMDRILAVSPTFFEQLIIDLLLAMGYGGSRYEAGERLGKSGDGGIDGVIREDLLGLDRIYLQAKRYQPGNSVDGESVRAFLGALISQGAQKGVFITTSSFTKQALRVAEQAGALRLILIDGVELTRLMIRFNVGVRVVRSIELKRIDLGYFEVDDAD